MPLKRIALIAGATGLTGRHLLNILLLDARYASVHALVRNSCLPANPKLEEHIVAFDKLPALPQADDVFCCLGTTIKKAGSQTAFRKVDFDYVVNLATAASQSGAHRFFVISAMGANAKSVVFYNRIKGEMEQALNRIGFPELHIFQPSILVGERQDFRISEKIGIATLITVAPFMLGPARKYRPIAADTVARAMARAAWMDTPGTTRYPSDQSAKIGETAQRVGTNSSLPPT